MYKNILLSVDLQDPEGCKKAVADSVGLSQALGAVLHVMTVVPDFGMSIVGSFFPKDHEKTVLEATRVKLHEFTQANIPAAISVQHIVGHGSVYTEVLRIAEETNVDLVVLGVSKPSAGKLLLGPNASRVALHANCSVLVSRE